MLNEQLDVRQLMTGKDGVLFIDIGEGNVTLAEIESYKVNMNVTNTDVQPVGSLLVYGVNTGVSFSLSFTEMVVRDDVTLGPLIAAVQKGRLPHWTFQGMAQAPDGAEQRVVYRNCIPDGSVDLQSLNPGEVYKREQSYRINSVPKMLKELATRSFSE